MSTSASARGPVARGKPAAPARATHALSPGESAWLAALPCALLLLVLVLLLGPPLGRAAFEPTGADAIWAHFNAFHGIHPEPTEHARYVLALLGPVLAVAALLALRGRRVRERVPAAASLVAQSAIAAFVIACIVAQRTERQGAGFLYPSDVKAVAYFTAATLAASVALALLAAAALGRPALIGRVADATRETPGRRNLALAVAGLATGAYLLTAFNTEATAALDARLGAHLPVWLDEAASILDGQAPLVDFHAQYGQLWAYLAAGGMTLLGASVGVYYAIMLAGTAGTMAALFATLRRTIGGSSALALTLFLPVLATSFFMKLGPPEQRYTPGSLLSMFPMRYGGPYVLLWLSVRRVDAGTARRPIALLALAGLVTINNPEFGIPAAVATLAVLAWALPVRSPSALGRLALDALAGAAIAIALVAALTLAVGGSLPHFGMLLTYPRIFGVEGFGLMPMPALGLHLVVYLTFAAGIVVATVRTLSGERDALTAALGWTGAFGLGAGAYYAGRSHPQVLIDVFSVWALGIALLGVVVVQAIVRRPARRPQLAELLVLVGLGVTACSLAQFPLPWQQLDRLGHGQPRDERLTAATEEVVARLTRRDEPVALLVSYGHAIAARIGIRDVAPYADADAMLTRQQWAETLAALERAHGRKLLAETNRLYPEQVAWLARHGYEPYAEASAVELVAFAKGPPPRSGS